MKGIQALVLAAGKSERISSISQGQPKPLIEMRGESVLSRNLRWLAHSGIKDVWINLHYKPDAIINAVGDGRQFGLTIRTIFEPEILGTAGAVKNLANELSRTFLVVYGDNLFSFDLEKFHDNHKANQGIATIALFHRRNHFHTGIAGGQVLLENSSVQGFLEGGGQEISPYVNTGVYFLDKEIIDSIPANRFFDFGKDLFPVILQKGKKIAGYVIEGYCLGIDTPESYQRALYLIEQRKIELL